MSTLMATIAAKVLAESEPAPPVDNGIEHPTCAVPKEVISELETAVEFHIGHGNEFKESGAEEKAKFEFSCAETMQELLILLRKGDEKHLKLATIALFSVKNSIQNKVPRVVTKLLVPNALAPKSLQEMFIERLDRSVVSEGTTILAESVFDFIVDAVSHAKSYDHKDNAQARDFRDAAKNVALLVCFMQIDKQTNTSGEEELRSYVPIGALFRDNVQQTLSQFAQFIDRRGKELDFGRFDPNRVIDQYQRFLTTGGEDQWDAVAGQLTAYFKKRQSEVSKNDNVPANKDTYEMRARAERGI